MKPYIQIMDKEGKVSYIHSEGNGCEVTISGEKPDEFSTAVIDQKENEKEFVFPPAGVGRIMARTIASDTADFVKAMFGGNELYELIECQELFYGWEGFDHTRIEDFQNYMFGTTENFFFRLTEDKDGKWILSFVFDDEAVSSLPTDWEEFSR